MFTLLGLTGAAATMPGTLELAVLTVSGAFPAKVAPAGGSVRRIAVVVPAHDEAAGITHCVASLKACEQPIGEFELVVVADNCTDNTADLAREAGARVFERHDPENRGKGFALEFAFDKLLAEFDDLDAILVVDADTEVGHNFLSANERWFAAGSDATQSRNIVGNPGGSNRTQLMNVAFLAFNVLRPRGRSNLGLSCGLHGNGFGISRRCLEAVPYTARSVVEDLEHHLNMVRAGFRVDFIDEATVSAEMPTEGAGVDTQRERWEGGRFRMLKEHSLPLLKEVVKGDVRLIEPLGELLLMPLAVHVGALCATAVIPSPITQMYAGLGLGVVAVHVATALATCGGTKEDIKALASVPKYVAWKALKMPKILAQATTGIEWVRTARAGEQ